MAPGLSLHDALAHPEGLWASMLLRVGLMTLASFPLAVAFRALPLGSTSRHILSVVAGALVLWVATSAQHLLHVLTLALVSYAIVLLSPPKSAGHRVMAFACVHVLAMHVARAGLLDSLLGPAQPLSIRARVESALAVREFQTAVMAAALKVSGFGYNVADGALPMVSLHPQHASHRLTSVPSILKWLGFLLFFPAVLGHPSFFAYAEYEHAVGDRRRCCPTPSAPHSQLPSRIDWRRVCTRALEGLGFALVHTLAGRFLPGCSKGTYLPSACYATSVLNLAKFFAFWRLSDGPLVIAGLLPSAQLSSSEHFTRVRSTLLAPDFGLAVRSWNPPVARFLKVHVFLRVPRSLALGLTFGFSALWHGVAAGYCVAAGSACLFVLTAGALHAVAPLTRGWPAPLLWAYSASGRVLSHCGAVWCFLPMMTVSGSETLALLRAARFAPQAVAVGLLVASWGVGRLFAERLSHLKQGAAPPVLNTRDTTTEAETTRAEKVE